MRSGKFGTKHSGYRKMLNGRSIPESQRIGNQEEWASLSTGLAQCPWGEIKNTDGKYVAF